MITADADTTEPLPSPHLEAAPLTRPGGRAALFARRRWLRIFGRRGRRWWRRMALTLRPLRRRLAGWRNARSEASEIHLAWCDDPCRTLTVCWAGSSSHNPARVEVRPEQGEAWRSVAGRSRPRPGGAGMLHSATVRDLEPGERYAYRVSCDTGYTREWSDTYVARTAPAPASGEETTVDAVFLCDVGLAGRADGVADAAPAVVAAIARTSPLVVLGGGDYAYADRDRRFVDPADAVSAWFDQMQPLLAGAPFLACLGNHEVHLGESANDWDERLPRPASGAGIRSFAIDVGAMHLVSLHAPGLAPASDELDWLRQDLESDAARAAPWRIVFQHAPLFAHGSSHPSRPEVRRLAPLFDELGVDLHLSGHDQSYERTHVIRGENQIVMPAVSHPFATYAASGGVVYAKVSPAGKRSDRGRGFSRFAAEPPPEIAARSDEGHHWARVRADSSTLEVSVDRLSEKDGDVEVADRFRLVRTAV